MRLTAIEENEIILKIFDRIYWLRISWPSIHPELNSSIFLYSILSRCYCSYLCKLRFRSLSWRRSSTSGRSTSVLAPDSARISICFGWSSPSGDGPTPPDCSHSRCLWGSIPQKNQIASSSCPPPCWWRPTSSADAPEVDSNDQLFWLGRTSQYCRLSFGWWFWSCRWRVGSGGQARPHLDWRYFNLSSYVALMRNKQTSGKIIYQNQTFWGRGHRLRPSSWAPPCRKNQRGCTLISASYRGFYYFCSGRIICWMAPARLRFAAQWSICWSLYLQYIVSYWCSRLRLRFTSGLGCSCRHMGLFDACDPSFAPNRSIPSPPDFSSRHTPFCSRPEARLSWRCKIAHSSAMISIKGEWLCSTSRVQAHWIDWWIWS